MTKTIGCWIFEDFGQLSQVKSRWDPLKRMSTFVNRIRRLPTADLQAQRQRQLDAGFSKNLGKCCQWQPWKVLGKTSIWKWSTFPVFFVFDQRKLGTGKIDAEELAKEDFCQENTKAKTRKNFTSNENRESRWASLASHYRPRLTSKESFWLKVLWSY